MKLDSRIFAAVGLAAVITCSASSCAATDGSDAEVGIRYAHTPRGLVVIGRLSPSDAMLIDRELIAGEDLYINSTGGDPEAFMNVAELLDIKGSRLFINSSCFDECSVYLFLIARDVHVMEGATVLFNYRTPGASDDLNPNDRVARQRSSPGRSRVELDARLRRALGARGINEGILTCISNADGSRYDQGAEIRPGARTAVWLSPVVLEAYGVDRGVTSWTLAVAARESYSELRQRQVVWVDDRDRCT